MAYASHEGQRLQCSISQNTEIAIYRIIELRRDFASKCWKAFDTDPSFDYDAAEKEIGKKITLILKKMKAADEVTINKFLSEKGRK